MIAEGYGRIMGDIFRTSAPHEYQVINLDGQNEEGVSSQHTPDVREMCARCSADYTTNTAIKGSFHPVSS